jgi:omega-6 fatty acid desaturase (delta-12 desaturase)
MTFWAHEDGWSFQEAALHGSSHYDLPGILRWFTANIGVHHVHHLCSRIPYYRLPRVLSDYPELSRVSRLTLLQSFRCVRLALWDESRRRLVSFHEIDRRPPMTSTLLRVRDEKAPRRMSATGQKRT